MARRMMAIPAVASALLAAAVGGMWVRSYVTSEVVLVSYHGGPFYRFCSHRGAVTLEYSATYPFSREGVRWERINPDWGVFSFGGHLASDGKVWGRMARDEAPQPPDRRYRLPYWVVFVGSAGWPVVRFVRRRRREARAREWGSRGCCVGCGYDLRGTPGRCPECGREVGGGGNPEAETKG